MTQGNLAPSADVLRAISGLSSPQDALPRDWSLDGKRLILTVTPGRSGTGYLSQLLGLLPGVFSAHEPSPNFRDVMRGVQYNPQLAQIFLLNQKLPAIRHCTESVYVETSHLTCKGFIEPLLNNFCVPDLIILRRDPFLVSNSLYYLDTIPARTPLGELFLLRPDDPGVVPLEGWQQLPDWALCFWYCREIERRMDVYASQVRLRGGRVITTSIDELKTDGGISDLLRFMDADPGLINNIDFLKQRAMKVNDKAADKRPKSALSVQSVCAMAYEVDRRLACRPSCATH